MTISDTIKPQVETVVMESGYSLLAGSGVEQFNMRNRFGNYDELDEDDDFYM